MNNQSNRYVVRMELLTDAAITIILGFIALSISFGYVFSFTDSILSTPSDPKISKFFIGAAWEFIGILLLSLGSMVIRHSFQVKE